MYSQQYTQQHHYHPNEFQPQLLQQHPQSHGQNLPPHLQHAQSSSGHRQHYNQISSVTNGSNGSQGSEHGQSFGSAEHGLTQEEKRILDGIAQLMNPAARESALLELSKKREQFPQLALILWHSFGMRKLPSTANRSSIAYPPHRRHGFPFARDYFCLPATQPVAAYCCRIQPGLQRPRAPSMRRFSY